MAEFPDPRGSGVKQRDENSRTLNIETVGPEFLVRNHRPTCDNAMQQGGRAQPGGRSRQEKTPPPPIPWVPVAGLFERL
jgi:hypothetical protein